MGKPLNYNDPGCNYTTSNCVIWQGPDIECINLCKGDTVSDVVYKLATEFCTLLDQFNIAAYDLSCFNISTCTPQNFQGLIQFLINQICNIGDCSGCSETAQNSQSQGGTPPSIIPRTSGGNGNVATSSGACPDCIISLPSCFLTVPLGPRYDNLGNQITTMLLADYVVLLGNTICNMASQITLLQAHVANHEIRISVLEAAPAPICPIPTIVSYCVNPGIVTPIDYVIAGVEKWFCELRDATGFPTVIGTNINLFPAGINSAPRLSGLGTMSSYTGWNNTVNNMAAAVGNAIILITDMRQAIRNIQLNCCPGGCDGVVLILSASLSGTILTINVSGTIPTGFIECTPLGTLFTITDSYGASMNVTIPISTILNDPTGYPINLVPTPLNSAADFTITANACLNDSSTGTTCESCLEYTYTNISTCPNIILNALSSAILYSFITSAGTKTYVIELYNGAGTVLIQSFTHASIGVATIMGAFAGLTSFTGYKVRLVITPDGSSISTICPFTNITTLTIACLAPTNVVPTIELPPVA